MTGYGISLPGLLYPQLARVDSGPWGKVISAVSPTTLNHSCDGLDGSFNFVLCGLACPLKRNVEGGSLATRPAFTEIFWGSYL